MKNISYFLQAAVLSLFCTFMFILPVAWASNIGSFLGRKIGPLTRAHKVALKNLKLALPDKNDDDYNKLADQMWDNLGRTLSEYPHLKKITKNNIDVENEDIIKNTLESGKSIIFTGAHFGNWEIQSIFFMLKYEVPIALTYRAPNNPWVEKLLKRIRPTTNSVEYIAKSRTAGRNLVQTLQNKRHIGVLMDQKNNEGIAVPFFGVDAMTSPVFVQLAQKFDAEVICVRTQRNKGPHFTIRVEKPVALKDNQDELREVRDVLLDINQQIENWIVESPSQWLWIHNRWPKSA